MTDNKNMNIESIIDIRERIADPAGFIEIVSVASIPASSNEQTAYRVADNTYLDSDGERVPLIISDGALDALITLYGIDKAQCYSYSKIRQQLGSQLSIKKLSAGADSTEFISLAEKYQYYKNLENDCKEKVASTNGNNSGRMGQGIQPIIGGGMI
jgi:hypothetical protein